LYTNLIAVMYILFNASDDYNMYVGDDEMQPFRIDKNEEKISSVSRTIRMKSSTYDRIEELNIKTGVSFNKIVNQCLVYALNNYAEDEE